MTVIVVDEFLGVAVSLFAQERSWQFHDQAGTDKSLDRHKGFFVRQRLHDIALENPFSIPESLDPSAIQQCDAKKRVDAELVLAEAAVTARVGNGSELGPLFDPGDGARPAHHDLADLANVFYDQEAVATSVQQALEAVSSGTANSAEQRCVAYAILRLRYAAVILWRALALEPRLWTSASDSPSEAYLDEVALDEVLDRRLRAVEWMHYTVSSGPYLAYLVTQQEEYRPRWREAAAPTRGWKDGFRVRRFEYPSLKYQGAIRSMLESAGAVGSAADEQPYQDPHHPWLASGDASGITWNVPDRGRYPADPQDQAALHFPPSRLRDWTRTTARLYRCELRPESGGGAAAIDRMFRSTSGYADYMERAFLFCDQVMAAVQIEALLFGLRRRHGSVAADVIFDELCRRVVPDTGGGYVALEGLVGYPDQGILMGDPDDAYFQNTKILPTKLQVGDHVVFWNHQLYSLLQADEWKLENSMVMDIQNDPLTGEIWWDQGYAVMLCGHGMPPEPYGGYAESLAGRAKAALTKCQDDIDGAIIARNSNDDPADDIPLDGSTFVIQALTYPGGALRARVVRWSPYELLPGIGAWWIEIPETEMESRFKSSTALEALPFVPHAVVETEADGKRVLNMTVEADPTVGRWTVVRIEMISGYRSVPSPASLYFPLHVPVPRQGQGWHGYVTERVKGDTTLPSLVPMQIDARLIPGFLYFGKLRDTDVIRPRVRPSGAG